MRTFAIALASSLAILFSTGYLCAWQTIPDPMSGDPQALNSSPQTLKDYMNSSGEPLPVPQLGIQVRDDGARLNHGSVSGAGVFVIFSKNGGFLMYVEFWSQA